MSLEEIADRLEIQDLLVAYSYAIDGRDWDALDDLFTADAYIDYADTGGAAGDLAQTKHFLAEAMLAFSSFQHMVATSKVEIDGDTAQAKTICHNPLVMALGDDQVQVMFSGFWYVDDLVRTAGGWRIARRIQRRCYLHNAPDGADA